MCVKFKTLLFHSIVHIKFHLDKRACNVSIKEDIYEALSQCIRMPEPNIYS